MVWGLYILYNSISVISEEWKGKHEGLCAMKHHLGSERISLPAGFEPVTLLSQVQRVNHSSMQTTQFYLNLVTRKPVFGVFDSNLPAQLKKLYSKLES